MSQNKEYQAAGKIIVHIRDLSSIVAKSLSVAPYTNIKLLFHTDYGDVRSMLVLSTPSEGGNRIWAPVASVYNEIADSRPDLISTLSAPGWPFDRPVGGASFEQRPLLFLVNGKPEMIFSQGGLWRSKTSLRSSDMPLISASQAEALDTVHFTARKYCLSIVWQKGDILFFNNHKTLSSESRHFLRLWLQDKKIGGLPSSHLQVRWDHIFAKRINGDGVNTEADEERWPLQPISSATEALSKRI